MRHLVIAALACTCLSAPVLAQQSSPMVAPDMKMMAPAPGDPASTKAYKAGMMKMMDDMAKTKFRGDPDVDFMTQMRVHHQGAIDMTKVALSDGKDAEVKKLAQEIIAAQQKEIAEIDSWLKTRGH